MIDPDVLCYSTGYLRMVWQAEKTNQTDKSITLMKKINYKQVRATYIEISVRLAVY